MVMTLVKFDTMKKIIFILFGILGIFVACQDVTPGYLSTEFAGYTMDSMVVKKELDLTPPEPNPDYEMYLEYGYTPEYLVSNGIYPTIGGDEYKRDKYGWPWTSTPIEGVEGTQPIYVSIKDIKTDVGDVELMRKYLKVSGNGTFTLPVYTDIPIGRYVISLTFTNEGYTRDVDDCFTIIVTQR